MVSYARRLASFFFESQTYANIRCPSSKREKYHCFFVPIFRSRAVSVMDINGGMLRIDVMREYSSPTRIP
jgi:hypothetical protein